MSKSHKFLCQVEAAFKTPSLSKSVSFEELVKDIDSVFSPDKCYGGRSGPLRSADCRVIDVKGEDVWIDFGNHNAIFRLSGCSNLYVLELLRLLVAAYRQNVRLEREVSEFLCQLCFERKKLITTLRIILEAIVLQRNLEQDSGAIIQKVMQDHLNNGLRTELINLIKHCCEQATTISDGSGALSYIVDSRDVYEEWVMLAHCLFLSSLVHPSPGDLTDVFCMLKDHAAALVRIGDGSGSLYQVICGLLFSIITPLLPASADYASVMPSVFPDVSSRNIFHGTHCCEEATTVSNGSGALSYIVDSQDLYEEWVMLAHCLFLSSLVVQPSPGDLTDVFCMLKDNAAALVHIGGGSGSQYEVICGLLFSIITPLLPASADFASAMPSVFPDVISRNIFHESVMTSVGDAFQDGIIACVRLAWVIHLMIIERNSGRKLYPVFSSVELQKIDSCLDTVFSNNAFQVFVDIYFKNVACKADEEDLIHIYNTYLHNLITRFLSVESFQLKVEEVIDMTKLFPRGFFEDECKDLSSTKKAFERANEQMVSLLQFVCEIYKLEPQFLSAPVSVDVWCLGVYMWNKIGNYQAYDASLMLLCTLAYNEKGVLSVFEWVQDEMCNPFSWRNFFGFLEEFSKNADCSLSEFPEYTALIIAFLHLLMVVLHYGNVVEREHWFPDVEPLFMFLSSGKLPDELEDKVKDAINTFSRYCPRKGGAIQSYCKKYNMQVGDGRSQRGKRPRSSSMELSRVQR